MAHNHLDLDGDTRIDYIRFFDNVDRNLHTISLKVALGQNEEPANRQSTSSSSRTPGRSRQNEQKSNP